MLLYSVAKYADLGASFPVIVITQTAGYLLAIYLYFGIARLVCSGRNLPVWIGFILAVVLGYMSSGRTEIWRLVCEWSMLFGTSVVVGAMARRGAESSRMYATGLAIVAMFVVLWIVPQWSDLIRAGELIARDTIGNFRESPVAAALGNSAVEFERTIESYMITMVRLLPALIGLGAITQFSIGMLTFERSHAVSAGRSSLVETFTKWRIPRAVTIVLAVIVAVRLLTQGTPQVIADNFLAAASPFYCITGLSLLEYYLQLFRFHWALKLVLYLALIPTGITGYFALVLFGLVTSIYEWRRQPE